MFKWRAIWDHFKQMNGYIIFGFILFFAGMVIGGTNPAFKQFLEGQMEALKGLTSIIDDSNNPTLTMILVIFMNNAIKSILVIYIGAFFGLMPIFFLVVNGMLIGFLLTYVGEVQGGAQVAELIFKGLLPHGILEIPAIVIACAYGMRFGLLTTKGLFSTLFARSKLNEIGYEIKHFIIRSVPVMVIITLTLLIASVIESTITGWLLSM